MGDVALTFRILPESPEVDLETLVGAIKEKLPEGAKWANHEVKPFAFGLKAIQAQIVVKDEAGGPDEVTDLLKGVDNVQGVELLDMGRLM